MEQDTFDPSAQSFRRIQPEPMAAFHDFCPKSRRLLCVLDTALVTGRTFNWPPVLIQLGLDGVRAGDKAQYVDAQQEK